MMRFLKKSISRKLHAVVLATTFLALLVSAIALVAFEIRNYREAWITDLTTQADILARVNVPALQFNDPETAQGNLRVLAARPQVLDAALYTPSGKLFAAYAIDKEALNQIPRSPRPPGYRIHGGQVTLYHRIVENGEVLGTISLRAHYELASRLKGHLAILAAAMVASMAIAVMVSTWLQRAITRPILAVTDVAREVMERRQFSLRVEKTTEDEVGVLVDAFNGMLNEVDRRAKALEESNRSLHQEMKERRDAEEALLEADRRKDEFLATLAHELRNPLAPLLTGLEMMRLTGADSAASTRTREVMERQLRQMVRLVDDLIDVSRISTGKLAIRKGRCELQSVIQSAVETAMPVIRSRGHEFDLDLPPRRIMLDADATRLSQVFSNLLNNAAKYTNDGGRISCHAAVKDGRVAVVVRDSGIGISQDMLDTVFEMFTQADRSLERLQAGLGVGLTLARRLVELHGGTIEAGSEGVGKGSVFRVLLPVLEDDGSAIPDETEPCADPVGRRFRILLADDNEDFVNSMAELLSAIGHEVRVAHDGASALELAALFQPEFAFLDIGLPRLNGYDLARRMRTLPGAASCTLVAVTGWGQEKDRQMAAAAGFEHHVVKPASFASISAILDAQRERDVH